MSIPTEAEHPDPQAVAEDPRRGGGESDESLPVRPPQPPLSIAHLMLWMLAAGLILALHRAAWSRQEAIGWLRNYEIVQALLSSIVLGISVASVMLAVWRKLRRGPAFPSQPGHWLLVILGLAAVLNYASGGLWRMVGPEDRIYPVLLALLLGSLVPMTLSGILCVRLRDAVRWRVLLAGLAGHYALSGAVHAGLWAIVVQARYVDLYDIANPLFQLGTCALLVGTVVVAVLDLRGPARRDWLHWLGLATQILALAFSLLSHMAFQVLQKLLPLY